MPRVEPVAVGIETEETKTVFDTIRTRGDEPSPLYRTLAHAPALLVAWASFADALRRQTSLERSVSELVIMRLGQLSDAPYQWAYHWKPALAAGITEAQLGALQAWREQDVYSPRQRAALAYSEAMFAGAMSDPDFDAVSAEFDIQSIVELTLTIGFYVNVGRVLDALQIEVADSRRQFLP